MSADNGPPYDLFGMNPAGRMMTALAPAASRVDRKSAVSMVFDDPINPMMLDIWMETLIEARWTGSDRKSRVVIIGRELPRELLLDSLDVLKTRPMVHGLLR